MFTTYSSNLIKLVYFISFIFIYYYNKNQNLEKTVPFTVYFFITQIGSWYDVIYLK